MKRFEKKATIKDIARMGGVSISTVSCALNNSPKVRPEKRDLIQSIARQLNYVPHDLARGLVTGNYRTIGLNIGIGDNPYLVNISDKIIHIARENGYGVLTSIWQDDESRKKDLNMFIQKSLNGIISGPIFGGYDSTLENIYNNHSIPMVMIGNSEYMNIPQIGVDFRKAIFLVTEHLIKLGHKEIGYLCMPPPAADWLGGFKDSLLEYSVKYFPEWCIEGLGTLKEGYDKMKLLLKSASPLPSAFVCHNDLCACGALRALSEAGLKVPLDMSLTGVDNIEAGMYCTPSLTTVNLKEEDFAIQVFNQLKKQIEFTADHKMMNLPNILIEPELIVRESTAPCKGRKIK